DRLQTSKRIREASSQRRTSFSGAAEKKEDERGNTRGDLRTFTAPPPLVAAPALRAAGGNGSGDGGEEPAGDMATSRPRLFLWRQPRQRPGWVGGTAGAGGKGPPARHREVTFGYGEEEKYGSGTLSSSTPIEAPDGHSAAGATTALLLDGGGESAVVGNGAGDGGGGRVGGGSGSVLRPDFIQLSYAMKKSPVRGGSAPNGQRGQESHRVKLLVGDIEVALEQETILAVMRVVDSLSSNLPSSSSSSSSSTSSPPPPPSPALAAPGDPGRSDTEPVLPSSTPTDTGDGRSGVEAGAGAEGGDILVPMLPQGVSVSVVVDLAAASVALTGGGVGVAAVALKAAHCKVNAEHIRVKAVMSLGDLYVLNLRRPPPPRIPSAHVSARGGRECRGGGEGKEEGNGTVSPAIVASAAQRELRHGEISSASDDGWGGFSLDWVEPVLGRGEDAVGPVLDVAMVVVPCGKGGTVVGLADGGGVHAGDVIGSSSGGGGGGTNLEARVKVRLDAVRADLSIPFVESLTWNVLTGPLLSPLVQGGEDSSSARTQECARSRADAPAPSATGGGAGGGAGRPGAELQRLPSSLSSSTTTRTVTSEPAEQVVKRWEGRGDAPREETGSGAEDGSSLQQLVFVKVGLEVCDCALGIPFDGLDTDGLSRRERRHDDRINRIGSVTARVGHLYSDTTWTQAASPTGDGEGCPGGLHVETLVSSATVKAEPEGFDILQAVHVRAVATVPLGTAARASDSMLGGAGDGGGRSGGGSSPRDELAEKLRDKTGRDHPAAVDLLPARPAVSRRRAAAGVSDVGVPADCPRLGVAVSPIRFNITEPHVVSLACFALDATDRLAAILDVLSPPPSAPPDPQAPGAGSGGADGDAIECEAEEVGSSTTDELDGADRASRSGASPVAAPADVDATVGDSEEGGTGAAGDNGEGAAAAVRAGAAEAGGALSPASPRRDQDSPRSLHAPASSDQFFDGPASTTG
ncbi:unnamed protein product, partial [Scytosiphon promiscuus]